VLALVHYEIKEQGGPKNSKLFIIIKQFCLLTTNFHNFWHTPTLQ